MKIHSRLALLTALVCFACGVCQAQQPHSSIPAGFSDVPIAALTKLAESGNAAAQYELADRYGDGKGGVPENLGLAFSWMNKAAALGNPEAAEAMASFYSGEVDGARELGIQVDKTLAQQWEQKALTEYRKSAEAGDVDSQLALSWKYKSGRGVVADRTEAIRWLNEAVKRGSPKAFMEAGQIYDFSGKDLGIEPDFEKAASWYTKAAESGIVDAYNKLGDLYRNRFIGSLGKVHLSTEHDADQYTRDEPNLKKALAYYQESADRGDAWGQRQLGFMFENGWGCSQDIKKAVEWYRKAAAQGNAVAKEKLKALAPAGLDLPKGHAPYVASKDSFVPDEPVDSFTPDSPLVEATPAPVAPRFEDTVPINAAIPSGVSDKDAHLVQAKKDYSPLLLTGFALYILALIIRQKPTTSTRSHVMGGWLLFFCVTLVILSPIFSLGKLEVDRQQSVGAYAQYPALLTAAAIEAIGIIAFVLSGVVLGLRIWRRDPNGVQLARRYLQIRLFTFIGVEVIALFCLTELPRAMFNQTVGSALLVVMREVVIVGVWWLYFSKSKRVKETYSLTQTAPPPLIEHPDTTESPPMSPLPAPIRSDSKKERPSMDPVKQSVLIGVAAITILLVFFMPYKITKTRTGEDALPSTMVERCFILNAPSVTNPRLINRYREGIVAAEISTPDIILYLLISSALGAGVWALSRRKL